MSNSKRTPALVIALSILPGVFFACTSDWTQGSGVAGSSQAVPPQAATTQALTTSPQSTQTKGSPPDNACQGLDVYACSSNPNCTIARGFRLDRSKTPVCRFRLQSAGCRSQHATPAQAPVLAEHGGEFWMFERGLAPDGWTKQPIPAEMATALQSECNPATDPHLGVCEQRDPGACGYGCMGVRGIRYDLVQRCKYPPAVAGCMYPRFVLNPDGTIAGSACQQGIMHLTSPQGQTFRFSNTCAPAWPATTADSTIVDEIFRANRSCEGAQG